MMIININLFYMKTTDLLYCGTNMAECWEVSVLVLGSTLDF